MSKSNSFLNESLSKSLLLPNFSSNLNNPQQENQNSSQIFCSKCKTLSLSSIKIQRQKESKKFNLNITCKNNHSEEFPLDKFDIFNKKMFRKECEKCKQKVGIKNIYYCFKCKKYYCSECQCEHYKEDKKYVSNYYGLLENRCSLHNNKIQEYFCKSCFQYLCKECLKNHNKNHKDIVSLMEKFDYYQRLMKNEIVNEKNLVIKYNEILNSVRKIIITNIQQKKMVLDIKKSILNSYINNNMNYFNIINIDFAKNELNNYIKYDQSKIKKLYDLCKKNYMNLANDK